MPTMATTGCRRASPGLVTVLPSCAEPNRCQQTSRHYSWQASIAILRSEYVANFMLKQPICSHVALLFMRASFRRSASVVPSNRADQHGQTRMSSPAAPPRFRQRYAIELAVTTQRSRYSGVAGPCQVFFFRSTHARSVEPTTASARGTRDRRPGYAIICSTCTGSRAVHYIAELMKRVVHPAYSAAARFRSPAHAIRPLPRRDWHCRY